MPAAIIRSKLSICLAATCCCTDGVATLQQGTLDHVQFLHRPENNYINCAPRCQVFCDHVLRFVFDSAAKPHPVSNPACFGSLASLQSWMNPLPPPEDAMFDSQSVLTLRAVMVEAKLSMSPRASPRNNCHVKRSASCSRLKVARAKKEALLVDFKASTWRDCLDSGSCDMQRRL